MTLTGSSMFQPIMQGRSKAIIPPSILLSSTIWETCLNGRGMASITKKGRLMNSTFLRTDYMEKNGETLIRGLPKTILLIVIKASKGLSLRAMPITEKNMKNSVTPLCHVRKICISTITSIWGCQIISLHLIPTSDTAL